MTFLLVSAIAAFTADAVIISCSFDYNGLPSLFPLYSCVGNVTVAESTTLQTVTGDHLPDHTNDNVGFLWISNQNMPFFPAGIVEFFANLEALRFVNNNILSISAEDLQPFPRLNYLVLAWNTFTSLPGDLFSHNPRLQYINLGSNQIRHIGHDLVTSLNLLHTLYMSNNLCINENALTRADVIRLAPNLSHFCPPLDETTTFGTTSVETTTSGVTSKPPTEECPCDNEIEELRQENLQQNEEIAQQNFNIEQLQQSNSQLVVANERLFELNAALEERLLEIEIKLREISSTPASK